MSLLPSRQVRVAVLGQRLLLRSLLDAAFRGSSGFDVVPGLDFTSTKHQQPEVDLVVVDAFAPARAFASIEAIRRETAARVMVVTPARGDYHLFRAGRAGATGFVHEGDDVAIVVEGARKTADGHIYHSPAITRLRGDHAIVARLTKREMQVMEFAARGFADDVTAAALDLAAATVESHRTTLMRKIGARDWAHLLVIGLRVGIGSVDDIDTNSPARRSARRGNQ
jgi:DNA-binding NarL/FixJ family response regulator